MRLATAVNSIVTYYRADLDAPTSYGESYPSGGGSYNRKRAKRFFRNSTFLPFILVGLVVLVILVLGWDNIFGSPTGSAASGRNDSRVALVAPKSQQAINRSFEFPLKDQEGKEVSKLRYDVQSAELRDEIVVKGERVVSVKGKTFLVVNLKVTNNFDKTIRVNVKDYVRLIINNSADKIAADIHNDPVEVLAESTKLTRIAFPISDTDTNLTLQIGEINGSKQTIKLDLK